MSDDGEHDAQRDAGEALRTLAEVRDLRNRTRALAHGGVWFPVAVIAALLLASISLYTAAFSELLYMDIPYPYWAGLPDVQRSTRLSYAFWFLLTPTAFALIAWWYQRRARHLGVRTQWRWVVGAGLGALLALALLAAIPSTVDPAMADMMVASGFEVDILRGFRTPIVAVAAALIVLAWAERSVGLAVTGAWIGILAWWFCAAGQGRVPAWLGWAIDGFEGPVQGGGGTLALPGRPGPVLIAMCVPLLIYAAVRGRRAHR